MLTYTYVDNSNAFIEGQRVSAVTRGMAANIVDAMNRRIVDFDWNIDYGKLHQFVCGGEKKKIGCAKLWGSIPPKDEFWQMVESKGFKHVKYEKNFVGKEKKVDVAIAHQMTKDAYTIINKMEDEIVLVSGDKDFCPVVEDLVAEGFKVCVVFWEHAAQELKDCATSFVSLNRWLDHLGR